MCLSLFRSASPSSAALLDSVRGQSGIDAVRRMLEDVFRRESDPLKASSALSGLERVAFRLEPDDPRRALLQDAIEMITLEPRMHRLNELRALQEQATGRLRLAPALEADLRQVVMGTTTASRLGQPEDANAAQLLAAASAGASRWKRCGNDARSSPTERRTAEALTRSYELMWQQVSERQAN